MRGWDLVVLVNISKVPGKRSSPGARVLKKQKRAEKRFVEKAKILLLLEEHLATKDQLGVDQSISFPVVEQEDILILEANEFSQEELYPSL